MDKNSAQRGNMCRFCATPLKYSFVDLGMSPPCQTHIEESQLNQMEAFYPLHAFVCEKCFLVQLGEFVTPSEIFSEYAYFSSFADTWLLHCKNYAAMAIEKFHLGKESLVVELASNDGYLLQYFREKNVPVLGVEPAKNVARVAIEKGIPTVVDFFGCVLARKLKQEHKGADVIAANNVLAHVPDLNDFVGGMKILLNPHGVITVEFPHLIRLMEENQFDTIYHEHFSYFSFTTVERVFAFHGLTLFDVDELPTHGGSLRIYGCHAENIDRSVTPRVLALKESERQYGINNLNFYQSFGEQVKETKRKILELLIRLKRENKKIVGYGAPGKGNTLLNYCGIRTDFLDFTVDRNPYKQGKFTPGTHIPIYSPDKIKEVKPDYVFILPWNLKDEIIKQNAFIREWGGKFIVPIPETRVIE